MEQKVNDDVLELSKKTDLLLWSSFERATNKEFPDTAISHLVFPTYSTKKDNANEIRVSEQEARFAFVETIVSGNYDDYAYSVETPTSKKYKFTGESEESAQTDLSLYDNNISHFNDTPILRIEFKEGGISLDRKDRSDVTKDVEKLLREPDDGLWFHLLKSTYKTTITNLFEVFRTDMLKVYNKYKDDIKDKEIIFHICVLRPEFSVCKKFEVNESSFTEAYLKDFFQFDYSVEKGKLIKPESNNGWNIKPKMANS
jgi:hypothetical protein